jgi:hypothetical protein
LSFVIDESLDIDAPSELVWEVITDLPRYGEWNPFVIGCKSSLVEGDPIDMRVQIFRQFAQPQREYIKSHVPGEKLCYGLPPQPLSSLTSMRCHEVEPLGEGRCRYRSHFELSGWLAPVVKTLGGGPLGRGFAGMTAAIKQRAEDLQTERGQA